MIDSQKLLGVRLMSNSISASSFSSSISSCAAVLSRVQRQMMEEPQHASSLIGNEGLELAPELHGALRHAAALNALRSLSSDALTAQENSLFFINIVPRMNEG